MGCQHYTIERPEPCPGSHQSLGAWMIIGALTLLVTILAAAVIVQAASTPSLPLCRDLPHWNQSDCINT